MSDLEEATEAFVDFLIKNTIGPQKIYMLRVQKAKRLYGWEDRASTPYSWFRVVDSTGAYLFCMPPVPVVGVESGRVLKIYENEEDKRIWGDYLDQWEMYLKLMDDKGYPEV